MLRMFACMFAILTTANLAACVGAGPPGPDRTMAWGACDEHVKRRLRAPSTAEFARGPSRDHVTRIDSLTYHVTAYVDAENAFGAITRTDYECTVAWRGEGRWRLVSLELTPR